MSCINCGNPIAENDVQHHRLDAAWQTVTKSRTPINVFALAMMSCASILGISATAIDGVCDLTAFKYTLHIFLAVSGMFFATILFCRKGMYHPQDIAKAKQEGWEESGEDKPVIAAVLICLMLLFYGLYQLRVLETQENISLKKLKIGECVNQA